MAKPYIHAASSVRKYGGTVEDYLPIHQFMDSSKNGLADNRHRVMTHNSWFISPNGPLEMAFGVTVTNSDGRLVSVRDIGEQHILEDFGGKFIPTPQDWLEKLPLEDWMNNGRGDVPPSYKVLESASVSKLEQAIQNMVDTGKLKLEDLQKSSNNDGEVVCDEAIDSYVRRNSNLID